MTTVTIMNDINRWQDRCAELEVMNKEQASMIQRLSSLTLKQSGVIEAGRRLIMKLDGDDQLLSRAELILLFKEEMRLCDNYRG